MVTRAVAEVVGLRVVETADDVRCSRSGASGRSTGESSNFVPVPVGLKVLWTMPLPT